MDFLDDLSPLHWLQLYFDFCLAGRPCVIGEKATCQWLARQLWVRPDGSPDNAYLRLEYGDLF